MVLLFCLFSYGYEANLIYTDTPFSFQENFSLISNYADKIRDAAFEALEEEAILIVVMQIYHSV